MKRKVKRIVPKFAPGDRNAAHGGAPHRTQMVTQFASPHGQTTHVKAK